MGTLTNKVSSNDSPPGTNGPPSSGEEDPHRPKGLKENQRSYSEGGPDEARRQGSEYSPLPLPLVAPCARVLPQDYRTGSTLIFQCSSLIRLSALAELDRHFLSKFLSSLPSLKELGQRAKKNPIATTLMSAHLNPSLPRDDEGGRSLFQKVPSCSRKTAPKQLLVAVCPWLPECSRRARHGVTPNAATKSVTPPSSPPAKPRRDVPPGAQLTALETLPRRPIE